MFSCTKAWEAGLVSDKNSQAYKLRPPSKFPIKVLAYSINNGTLMLTKTLSIVFILTSFLSCSTSKLNNREVASLGEVSPSEKGACIEIIKTFIGKKKIIKKKGLSEFFPSNKSYSSKQIEIANKVDISLKNKKFTQFSESKGISKFQTYSYLHFANDSSKEVDPVEFNKWFLRYGRDHIDDTESFKDNVDVILPVFKEWKKENGFSFKNLKKLKKKSPEDIAAEKVALELASDNYNNIIHKKVSSYVSYEKFLDDVSSSISNFHMIEENFQGDDFYRWLSENDILSREFFDKLKSRVKDEDTLGDFLSGNYSTFLPFSKKPDLPKKSVREKIQSFAYRLLDKKKSAIELCGDDADCVSRETRGFFERLIGMEKFKKSFSCLRQFPVARNAMYVDFVVTWAMLGHMYKSNEDEFSRFPWEVVTNGLIFTPIMSEINCQSSFQTRNAFGGAINLAKQPSRTKTFLRNWRRMAGVSLVSGVSLVGLGVGYNELYASMGSPVENTENLREQMKLLPFMFMWSGVLGSLGNMAIVNPVKYKIIPKIATMIQTKTGIAAAGVAGITAMNVKFESGREFYNSFAFNEIWRYHFLPVFLEIAGYDRPNDDELNGKQSVHAFDENSDIYITEYENGVSTKVTVEKSYDENGKEYIKVEDIDLEIPNYILEESVEDIPKVD